MAKENQSRRYWLQRSRMNLLTAEKRGFEAMGSVLNLYEQALQNINKDINRLYVNYAEKVGMDVMELTQVLTGSERSDWIMNIQRKIRELGFKVEDIYQPSYISRLTRLEALKQQVYWEIQSVAPKEVAIQESAYKDIINQAYSVTRTDISRAVGDVSVTMATITPKHTERILAQNWEGGNFISRTWANNAILNSRVMGELPRIQDITPEVVGGGLISGISQEKMARQIENYFSVQRYKSMRLIRTETNYFLNQAHYGAYEDAGIKRYLYVALLDGRTSQWCDPAQGGIGGEDFAVEDAVVGLNYPPLHPNCRSYTQPIFDDEIKEEKTTGREDSEGFFDDIYETNIEGLVGEGGWKRR